MSQRPDGAEIPPPPFPARPNVAAAAEIARALQTAGHEAYFVGGAVRDWLLGREIGDIDLATSAHPEHIMEIFGAARSVGAHFGVMLVSRGGFTFEVATFRSEGGYVDRRRPTRVRYGTLEEDYRRRDFTINALYYDPVSGRLIDPAGGRADIARRSLRMVGDPRRRLSEDALRLLRAVRFAMRFDLTIEPRTQAAIREHAQLLREISMERIAEELLAILTGPHAGRAMVLMSALGLWREFMPEIEAMHGVAQPPSFHPEGDVFTHTALALENLAAAQDGSPSPVLALGTLLHDVGKPPTYTEADRIRFPQHQKVGARMADAICRRLRLSNDLREQVVALVEDHMRFMDVRRMKRARLARFLGRDDFALHLALHRADCLASHGKLANYDFCRAERARLAAEQHESSLLPPPLINGRDLIVLGLQPGPRFKDLLEAARDEQLEGRLATREEALAWIEGRVAVLTK